MGALKGAKTVAQEWLKKTVFCFAKGTLIWTTVGLVAIENIQPGDIVYAKEAEGIEQSVDVTQEAETAPVLEVYEHEVDETYIVTIDGEEIE
ncbi:MAG: Hint domain-containing protein, partial [Pseudobutyrivibrio sp.]|nr:Hint domain-containing protein [Pseudobutyrivibrio sp.]